MKKLLFFLFSSAGTLLANCGCPVTDSARPCPCNSGPYVTGEYLYWKGGSDFINFATVVDGVDLANGIIAHSETKKIDFSYESGYRVGAGYNFCYDGWTLFASWTHYKTSPSRRVRTDTPRIAVGSGAGIAIPNIEDSSLLLGTDSLGEYLLDYGALDVELGRYSLLGCAFEVHPFFGVKAIWLKQDFSFTLSHVSSVQINDTTPFGTLMGNQKGKFWGVGPKVGTDAKWNWFSSGFGVYGKVAGALLWGEFENVSQTLSVDFVGLPPLISPFSAAAPHKKKDQEKIRSMIEGQIGIDFAKCFWCDTLFFRLRVGFEANYFWRQDAFNEIGDVYLKGLIVSGSLGF